MEGGDGEGVVGRWWMEECDVMADWGQFWKFGTVFAYKKAEGLFWVIARRMADMLSWTAKRSHGPIEREVSSSTHKS